MKHLQEMCCAACIAKLELIEQRAANYVEFGAEGLVQAIEDRGELLTMMEALLGVVSRTRAGLRQANDLLLQEVHAIQQRREQQ